MLSQTITIIQNNIIVIFSFLDQQHHVHIIGPVLPYKGEELMQYVAKAKAKDIIHFIDEYSKQFNGRDWATAF